MNSLRLVCGYYLDEFARFFIEFNLTSATCIIVGIMLIIIEFNHNDSKRLYFFGVLFLGAGAISRLLAHGTIFMAFILVLIIALILCISYIILLLKNKKAWFVKASTLSVNLEVLPDGKNSYSFLLGLEGDATTDINPQGHISINDINFFVTSEDNAYIKMGKRVKVTSADKEKIYVQSMEPEELLDIL